MREIKFEYVFINHETGNVIREQYDIKGMEGIACDDIHYHSERGYKLEARRQFTGMHDKNGVEIYEGDVIEQHCEWVGGYLSDDFGEMEFLGVASIRPSRGVVLNRCQCRDLIYCDEKCKRNPHTINVRSYRCEVIGNIYENPSLLGLGFGSK